MTQRSPFRYFKTGPEIIRLDVMMYVRFPLSVRNVEDLLHERGIDISLSYGLGRLPIPREPYFSKGGWLPPSPDGIAMCQKVVVEEPRNGEGGKMKDTMIGRIWRHRAMIEFRALADADPGLGMRRSRRMRKTTEIFYTNKERGPEGPAFDRERQASLHKFGPDCSLQRGCRGRAGGQELACGDELGRHHNLGRSFHLFRHECVRS